MVPEEYTVYISQTHDPWLNLSIENWIFQDIRPRQKVLFLSRNRESVVIGRFQNPWLECDLDRMIRDKVPLVRRQSGGGTVYHDLGNTNYSFIAPKEMYDLDENYQLLLHALRRLGIHAYRNERNDCMVEDKKFSGSAFKKTSQTIIHHGTLLHSADKERLKNYLTPTSTTITGKGIRSVPAKVINLSEVKEDINHEQLIDVIAEEISFHGKLQGIRSSNAEITEKEALEKEAIRKTYDEYRSWSWTFGKMPPFSQSATWKNESITIEVTLHSRHCVLDKIDFVCTPRQSFPVLLKMKEILIDAVYSRKVIRERIDTVLRDEFDIPPLVSSFVSWLEKQIVAD